MAIDILTGFVIGVALGAASGALSAFLGWNKSGEPFEARKFVSGAVTGIIAGVVASMAIVSQITADTTDTALLTIYITMFIAIIGVDNIRTAATGAIITPAPSTTTSSK